MSPTQWALRKLVPFSFIQGVPSQNLRSLSGMPPALTMVARARTFALRGAGQFLRGPISRPGRHILHTSRSKKITIRLDTNPL